MTLLPEGRVNDVLLEPWHPAPLCVSPVPLLVSWLGHGVDEAHFGKDEFANANREDEESQNTERPPEHPLQKHIHRLVNSIEGGRVGLDSSRRDSGGGSGIGIRSRIERLGEG